MRAIMAAAGIAESMSVRAVSLILLAVLLALSGAAGAVDMSAGQTDRFADYPVASDVRLAGDEAQTRMVVDFSRKVDLHAFTLANPYRVIIDLPQVSFRFPAKT